MTKSLDRKLAAIHADPAGCKEFILAAAKDADMGFGLTAPGPERDACPHGFDQRQGCFKTLDDYLRQIRHVTAQGLVGIMLLSASNLERLAVREGIFRDTAITPAARANDTSDIWIVRGGKYIQLAKSIRPVRPLSADLATTVAFNKYG